jgi:hypothetical protein
MSSVSDEHYVSLKPVCMGPAQVAGSIQRWCVDCGVLVWVGPDTLDFVQKYFATLLCWDCATTRTQMGHDAGEPLKVIASADWARLAGGALGMTSDVVHAAVATLTEEDPDGE